MLGHEAEEVAQVVGLQCSGIGEYTEYVGKLCNREWGDNLDVFIYGDVGRRKLLLELVVQTDDDVDVYLVFGFAQGVQFLFLRMVCNDMRFS